MDKEKLSFTPPPVPGRGPDICQPGQALSCTIQCAPGTRFPIERVFNRPGLEVCIVGQCTCQELPQGFQSAVAGPTVYDVALPLAFVIFGAELMMRGTER